MTNLRRRLNGTILLAGATALALSLGGCFFGGFSGSFVKTGPTQTETFSVPAGKAKSVRVHLKIGAGELEIAGGAKQLMDGTITYNVADWKPDMSYSVDGSNGTLMVMQPEGGVHTNAGNVKYDWDLHFSDKTQLGIAVEMGAGKSQLNLSGLDLQDFSMECGAGDATVDLSGPWKKNLSATFQGGVGSIRIKLPREVGVHVTVDGGLGSINAADFKRDGDAYVNDAYGHSKVTLEVHVEGGIGSVNLELAGSEGPA